MTTQLQLPAIRPFRQIGTHPTGWSDHYGALAVAAAHAGVALPQPHMLRGVWQHGAFGPWQQFFPGLLVHGAPEAEQRPVFVAREDEVQCLGRHGYQRVRAIGLPFVYVPEPAVPRIPGSLLVVPTHTLVGDSFPDRAPFQRYAEEIKGIAGRFDRVVVCLHPNCRKNGLWVDEFSQLGFEIVYGAQTGDANALLRIRMLFAQFENVTSNGWGSHIAYALFSGAKASIWGTEPVRRKEDLLRDTAWTANEQALVRALSPEVAQERRDYLRKFHVSPLDGVADEAFGRWFIGAENRLAPGQMREVLAELVEPRDVAGDLMAGRRALCRQARTDAAHLVAARRPAEAVQRLLRFVQLAAETKHPAFILEALREISADLQPLDPARAGRLQEQANLLAARMEAPRQSAA